MTQNTSSVSAPTVAVLPPWVPLWETGTWADGNLRDSCAPMSMWPWAFSHHQGIPIMLESKWTRLKDINGRTEGWQQDTSKIKNYHSDLRLTWDQVQKAVEIARRDDISLKAAVAGLVDRNDPQVPPEHFIRFAQAPEVKVLPKSEAVKTQNAEAQKAAADAYWAKVAVAKKG